MRKFAPILDKYIISRIGANRYCEKMATSLENIDKSKVSADRIEGLDAKIQAELSTAVTGAASTIITSDLTANKLLISNGNGKVAASTITSTDIDKVFSYYGTCDTAAATQTKDVVCSGFVLKTGSSIRVKFTNYQNYNGVFKLNVNSTGAKEVKRYGTTNSARYDFRAGEVISFTYDGTYWLMEDEGLADTTYFGKTKLTASATSTSTSLALTPSALNSYAQNTIANYPVYSTSSTYAVGDRIRYNWQTWECKTAITTAESWNADHWTALLDLQTQIDNIGSSSGSSRNIGEIVASTIPLTDAGLHLLDGGVIQRGSYADFVDYIAGLYNANPTANYFAQSHGELDWVQPVATGSTTAIDGGDMVITTSNEYSTYNSWKAMDGIKSGTDAATGWGVNNTSATQWWQLKLPYQIRITGIKVYHRYDTTPANANVVGRFYTSSDMTTPIGDTLNDTSATNWKEFTISGIPSGGIVTDTLYFQKTGGGNWGGLGEVEITATVVGTEQTAEQVWQQSVTDYGVCGKFVYDSVNNTVRLPKITGFTEGTTDVTALGDLIEAGLPNITGKFSVDTYINASEGAFYQVGGLSGPAASVSFGTYNIGETYIDASRSNSIYGNSDTVQPQSIKTLYYIVIATSTKTDIQIDIDQVATDLNGKVDKADLSTVHVVVETYVNGSSWYRIYDDGWVEQGGKSTSGTSITITFLKEFVDTNYTILGIKNRGGASGNPLSVSNVTTTTVTFATSADAAPVYWYACGQGV